MQKYLSRLSISLVAGLAVGAAVSALSPDAPFLPGWLASSLLLSISFFILLAAWNWAGKGKTLAWMMIIAFFLRLAAGITISLALPHYGYDNDHQTAGYMFKDSFYRDTAAWDLAESHAPLWAAFREEFATDQYGGLLSISAAVYRFLSPDAHRPFLILILAAFIITLGVPFFWKAIKERWKESTANLASWIYVLYPEGIFYCVSQMREPFLIGAGAILFWVVLNWMKSKKLASTMLVLNLVLMVMISWRISIAIILVSLVWFWLENYQNPFSNIKIKKRWFFIGAGVLVVIAVISSLTWLRTSMWWDFRMTEQNSARLVLEIDRLGSQFRAPIIIAFGVAQVVLPAAIAQPSIAIWRGLTIFRSAGWYLLVPVLLYCFVAAAREKKTREKIIILWLVLATYAWILLSSARAGGDLWDNPRYRTIFLPWMAFLASWAIQWTIANKDNWLKRLYMMEAVFLGFFTEWYLVRYHIGTKWVRLPFWLMIGLILGISLLIIIAGVLKDYWQSRKSQQLPK